ncbi:MAG: FAD-dependent oxidoreductase [Ignavibacterium sp.]|nr:FAD-dependent oxidoreductase [Ignavibacterium sp.]MDW8374294.1 FAD-dependent oxidoreductase [Ignavibacteriales bacterium]
MDQLKQKYDIIVAGAGIAGISAAVKAARLGASVLLIEHYGFVGGMSTAGMVSPFMKHSVNNETLVKGVFEDIEHEMINRKGMIDNGFYASAFRASAYNLLSDANCTILLNARINEVKRIGNKIQSVIVVTDESELEIQAEVFIDTTGDAQLVYLGGFPYQKGDEKTGKLQALTLFFRMAGIDVRAVTEYAKQHREDFFDWMEYDFDFSKIISIAGFFSFVKRAISEKRLSDEIQYIFFTTLPESGEGSFNTSNILGVDGSTSEELTRAELIGRKQVAQVVELLQNEVPGFSNSILLETAVQVGVRETRRAIGDYIVTGDDIRLARKFDDAIARACYGIDIHGQKDEESRMEHLKEGEYYEVPLRALIVKEAENLLVAGRCISSTREGHSALRIQPTSAATGEACGALAAIAVKNNKSLREIDYRIVQKEIIYNITKKDL